MEITRGHIRLQVGDRIAIVYGEMLVPTPGMSDFLIYQNTIER